MRHCVRAFVLASIALANMGCDEVGTAYLLISGPPKVSPVYELNEDRVTTVLIEDATNGPIPAAVLAEMRREVDLQLVKKCDIKDLVSGSSVARAASASEDLTLQDIGRSVGARTLVHVRMLRFSVTPDGQTFKPVSTMRVRVIDVKTGEQLWPGGVEGSTVQASDNARQGILQNAGRDLPTQVDAAKWAATVVSQLFHKHLRSAAANKGPAV